MLAPVILFRLWLWLPRISTTMQGPLSLSMQVSTDASLHIRCRLAQVRDHRSGFSPFSASNAGIDPPSPCPWARQSNILDQGCRSPVRTLHRSGKPQAWDMSIRFTEEEARHG
ncbi:hypothetical protein BKA61DRAFT_603407 [Leptodontidium sp. MPI-SDFR-AT-0119]|nr:hypothetical protein BKA61DRAFT_603407 [Leptodontidium sp. MPI-SDFR-AT-0119]